MRVAACALLLAVACTTAPPAPPPRYPELAPPPVIVPAAPRPSVAVLGLEPDDPADAPLARDLTLELRHAAGAAGTPFALAADRDRELAEVKRVATCANEAAACMAAIGADLRVDYLIYGHVVDGQLALALMDVAAHINRRVVRDPIVTDHAATAREAYDRLVHGVSRAR